MKTKSKGFTLIELMIVVAIIGILASLAVSAYQTYTIRAQVTEGMNMAGGAKSPVVAAFNENGRPPADRSEAGMTPLPSDTQGNYVSAVNIIDGRIEITFGNEANAEISGKTLSLTPYTSGSGSILWRCGNAPAPGGGASEMTGGGVTAAHVPAGFASRYLPSACR
jgi:type IV pilus assembly protein PilA